MSTSRCSRWSSVLAWLGLSGACFFVACSESSKPPGGGSSASGGSSSGTAGQSGSGGASGRGGSGSTGGAAGASAGSGGSSASGGSGGGGRGGSGGTSGTGGSSGGVGGTVGSWTGESPCPTNAQPCIILPLGDSITNGFTVPGGYRVELFRRARADGKRITFMGSQVNGPETVDGAAFPQRHEGHVGIAIEDLGTDWVPSPDTNDVPHIVLLMIGTNDIYDQIDVPNAPRRLGVLLDHILSTYSGALLVVAALTPMNDEVSPRPVETYNAAIRPLVEQRAAAGKAIMMVDMYTGFPASGLNDVVHPNAAGYRYLAGVWYTAVGSLLH
jgi:hypothetical protein